MKSFSVFVVYLMLLSHGVSQTDTLISYHLSTAVEQIVSPVSVDSISDRILTPPFAGTIPGIDVLPFSLEKDGGEEYSDFELRQRASDVLDLNAYPTRCHLKDRRF